MPDTRYTKEQTALPIFDAYNDFISEGGKLYEATTELLALLPANPGGATKPHRSEARALGKKNRTSHSYGELR